MIQIEDWEYEYNAMPTMMKNEKKWLLEQVQKDLWKCDFWKPAFYKVIISQKMNHQYSSEHHQYQ